MRLWLCALLLLAWTVQAQAQSVLLAWDPVIGATGYQVMGCELLTGQTTCTLHDLPGATPTTTTYTDTAVVAGKRYLYGVVATASGLRSDPSNTVIAAVGAPPMTAPGSMALTVLIPQNRLAIQVDSQETVSENGRARNALDGNPMTFWHTRWSTAPTPYPHWVKLALPSEWWVAGVYYLPRQDNANGRIKDYRIEGSRDKVTWTVLASGSFAPNDTSAKLVRFAPVLVRYVTLYGLSAWNGLPFASAAELGLIAGTAP